MVTTGCIRNAVSQVDVFVSRERRKASAARTGMEFEDIFLGYLPDMMIMDKAFGPLWWDEGRFLVGSGDTGRKRRCGKDSVGETGG